MSHNIGIIGGADGPTAIFVSGSAAPALWIAAGATAVLLAIWLFKRK